MLTVKASVTTRHGALFKMDCLELFSAMGDETVDCIFADPPFNLGKVYGSHVNDKLSEYEYLAWSQKWLLESIRVLKPGGSLFVYNIPKWQIHFGSFLLSRQELTFRNWIAVQMKNNFPRGNQLYPAHYGLLYFTKGSAKAFNRDDVRYPLPVCRHCKKPLPDWGGYKHTLHPKGVNLSDVWTDTVPQRHRKTKTRARGVNELDPKIPERAILLSTMPGDIVFDPFGGGGSTYLIAEQHHRLWIGSEIGDLEPILAKLERLPTIELGTAPEDGIIRAFRIPVEVGEYVPQGHVGAQATLL